jgi:hypothetical protein
MLTILPAPFRAFADRDPSDNTWCETLISCMIVTIEEGPDVRYLDMTGFDIHIKDYSHVVLHSGERKDRRESETP